MRISAAESRQALSSDMFAGSPVGTVDGMSRESLKHGGRQAIRPYFRTGRDRTVLYLGKLMTPTYGQ
jgi:hypothetical protein